MLQPNGGRSGLQGVLRVRGEGVSPGPGQGRPGTSGFQYKVLTQKDRYFGGKFDPMKLENAMNSYAQEGWRVVAVTSATIVGMGQNRV